MRKLVFALLLSLPMVAYACHTYTTSMTVNGRFTVCTCTVCADGNQSCVCT